MVRFLATTILAVAACLAEGKQIKINATVDGLPFFLESRHAPNGNVQLFSGAGSRGHLFDLVGWSSDVVHEVDVLLFRRTDRRAWVAVVMYLGRAVAEFRSFSVPTEMTGEELVKEFGGASILRKKENGNAVEIDLQAHPALNDSRLNAIGVEWKKTMKKK